VGGSNNDLFPFIRLVGQGSKTWAEATTLNNGIGHCRRGLTVGMGREMLLGIAVLLVQIGFKGHAASAAANDGIAGEERIWDGTTTAVMAM
jgi:hypothetical protein